MTDVKMKKAKEIGMLLFAILITVFAFILVANLKLPTEDELYKEYDGTILTGDQVARLIMKNAGGDNPIEIVVDNGVTKKTYLTNVSWESIRGENNGLPKNPDTYIKAREPYTARYINDSGKVSLEFDIFK